MKNILFYKFIEIDPSQLQPKIQQQSVHLKGKILLAKEGINGCVSGEDQDIEQLKIFLQEQLGPIEFKEGMTNKHTFAKMFVRIKKEIITFKQPISIVHATKYIEPQELKSALDKGEEIILLDARNNYESEIGKFKGAIVPDIERFSEFPIAARGFEHLKNKRIVTYCTGGIRCEKASAWMHQQGFTNVQQLHGGIIRYGEECGTAHWEGKCFVFDRRIAIDIDTKNLAPTITMCDIRKN